MTIAKSGITLRGGRGAVVDASGFPVGIRVAAGPGGRGCPPPTVSDVTIHGLRVERFAVRDGVYAGKRGVRDLPDLLP